MRHRHGLVVGKFYPPHAGHHRLIEVAAERCERVTVVACASSGESIPLELRVAWLREWHAATAHVRVVGAVDDHPIDYQDPAIWELHCAVFRAAISGAAVDAVFTSESYGAELARRFGAVHVCVDPDRTTVPVSGTAARADPIGAWPQLSPPVRAWLARRVVVVGAESSGTTTLARDLAAHYRARGGVWARTQWVPEFGRELTVRKLEALRAVNPSAEATDLEWTPEDFVLVVREQDAAEERAARLGSPLLICDTDSRATAVWEERYLGSVSAAVRGAAQVRRPALYLLTDSADVPFTDDGLRDGEHLREWMTGRFREVLASAGVPYLELAGPRAERLARAVGACEEVLAQGWAFADPLMPRREPALPDRGAPRV